MLGAEHGKRAVSALRWVLTVLQHVLAVLSRVLVIRLSLSMWSLHRHVSSSDNDALHGNVSARNSHSSHNSPARSLHSLHGACGVVNSLNSMGDGVARGRGVCRHGRTKPRSTSSRIWVRRPFDGLSPIRITEVRQKTCTLRRGRVALTQPRVGQGWWSWGNGAK